ncbi:Protein CBG07906, partial [Caenorhabditis briggsae]
RKPQNFNSPGYCRDTVDFQKFRNFRKLSKTPSVQEYKVKRQSERSPSFISSHASSQKSERSPSEVRIPVTVAHGQQNRPIEKRQSPEELDYGRFPENRNVKDLPYTRGVSKTLSDKTERYSNPTVGPKNVHIPYISPENERSEGTPELQYTRGISKTPSDKDYKREKSPSSTVHILYNNPEKERYGSF